MNISDEEVIIKIVWDKIDEKWGGILLSFDRNGFKKRPLRTGETVSFEVNETRRCVGYTDDAGMHPCPDFKEVDGGRRCYSCRNRDLNVDYVEGRSGEMRTGRHSVYLATAGGEVKVGVTRSSRLHRRWIEQGASYAAEIERFGSAPNALDTESQISESGVSERIGKRSKFDAVDDSREVLDEVMDELGVDGDIVDVQSMSMYDYPDKVVKFVRDGKISGTISGVKGQILYVDDVAFGLTRGRCIQNPTQKSLGDF